MKKRVITILIIAVIVLGFVCKDNLIRGYVLLRHEKLESYAEQILKAGKGPNEHYGIWETSCCHEAGMVEFQTGAWGLVPSSTYKGFYYSADDTHKVFSVGNTDAVYMEINGDHASWTDGTDNHGTSHRIMEKWFWYEASF